MALEQGREVYALPGRVSDSLSDGCNRLIRQGAGAATCPEDILEFFFGTGDCEHSKANKRRQGREQITGQKMNEQSSAVSGYPAGEAGEDDIPVEKLSLDQGILRILSDEDETHIERLFEQILDYEKQGLLSTDNYSLSDVVTCLIRMKIDGRVEESSAGYYVLPLRG